VAADDASVAELASQIRRKHGRTLNRLVRKVFSDSGEVRPGDVDPATGLPRRIPPSIEAPAITTRDAEVRVLASRMLNLGAAAPRLPPGSTGVWVSVSAHHARTRAPVSIDLRERQGWALALFRPDWEPFLNPQGEVKGGATHFCYYLDANGRPVIASPITP